MSEVSRSALHLATGYPQHGCPFRFATWVSCKCAGVLYRRRTSSVLEGPFLRGCPGRAPLTVWVSWSVRCRAHGLGQSDRLGFEIVRKLTTGDTLHLNLLETMKLSLPGVRFGGTSSHRAANVGVLQVVHPEWVSCKCALRGCPASAQATWVSGNVYAVGVLEVTCKCALTWVSCKWHAHDPVNRVPGSSQGIGIRQPRGCPATFTRWVSWK